MSSFPTLDPELLSTLERAQTGDAAAFEALVARYHSAVLRLLQRRLRHYHDAEDAAQQVFLELHRKLPRLRNPAAFNAWLCSLVRCQSATQLRRKRLEMAELSDAPAVPADPPCPERVELKTELLNSIERLNEPLRSTTKLFYLEGLSTQQISALTGSPLGTIKRRLHSARARLGENLTNSNLTQSRKAAKNSTTENFLKCANHGGAARDCMHEGARNEENGAGQPSLDSDPEAYAAPRAGAGDSRRKGRLLWREPVKTK